MKTLNKKQQAIIDAYLTNPKFQDKLEFILKGYLDDEDEQQLNERYKDLK